MNTDGCVLGVDFGLKRMGFAMGQLVTGRSIALGGSLSKPEHLLWKHLDAHIKSWAPGAIVFGKPLDQEGNTQPMVKHVFDFVRLCVMRYNIPVYWVNEAYTSAVAKMELGWHLGAGKNRLAVDARCAQMIIDDWFAMTDEQKEQSLVPDHLT